MQLVGILCLFFFVTSVVPITAQPGSSQAQDGQSGMPVSFSPSVAIIVGIFAMMFSLTFLLLMFAKFCRRSASDRYNSPDHHLAGGIFSGTPASDDDPNRVSGIDKAVIESLPFFRFAALRGARAGLECAVCLARFDDADLLRLLPRCHHAFHLDCIDGWLGAHASCPLCRARVTAADATLGLKYSASARFLFGNSDRFEESSRSVAGPDLIELFVERELGDAGGPRQGSSRFSIGSSFRRGDRAPSAAMREVREALAYWASAGGAQGSARRVRALGEGRRAGSLAELGEHAEEEDEEEEEEEEEDADWAAQSAILITWTPRGKPRHKKSTCACHVDFHPF